MPLDNQSELFYLVDKNDKVLGSIVRSNAHSDKSKIHRSVYVVISNSKNQLLLQKRSINKDTYPKYWAMSVGGHVEYGQSYEQAAKRETKEELGILPDLIYLTKVLIEVPIETEYSAIYTAKINSTPQNFDLDEIYEIIWVDIKDLKEFTKKEKVTPGAKKVMKILKYI